QVDVTIAVRVAHARFSIDVDHVVAARFEQQNPVVAGIDSYKGVTAAAQRPVVDGPVAAGIDFLPRTLGSVRKTNAVSGFRGSPATGHDRVFDWVNVNRGSSSRQDWPEDKAFGNPRHVGGRSGIYRTRCPQSAGDEDAENRNPGLRRASLSIRRGTRPACP